MIETWEVGYKFDETTGSKRPYEGWNTVRENGKVVKVVRWGSFATEVAADKGLKAKVARCVGDPIFTHDGKTIEYVGNMGA